MRAICSRRERPLPPSTAARSRCKSWPPNCRGSDWPARWPTSPIVKRWDVLIAPRPDPVDGLMAKFSMCSAWTSMNVLMLDHRRVVVEASQPTLHRALKDWGFEPLPVPFLAYGPFGGAFHCATLDTRRRGALEDYF